MSRAGLIALLFLLASFLCAAVLGIGELQKRIFEPEPFVSRATTVPEAWEEATSDMSAAEASVRLSFGTPMTLSLGFVGVVFVAIFLWYFTRAGNQFNVPTGATDEDWDSEFRYPIGSPEYKIEAIHYWYERVNQMKFNRELRMSKTPITLAVPMPPYFNYTIESEAKWLAKNGARFNILIDADEIDRALAARNEAQEKWDRLY
jgi:hypothetical protein